MPVLRERFCECICDHLCCFAVFQGDFAFFDAFSNKVILNIDMLCPCMIFWVLCKCNCALVIFVDYIPIDYICNPEILQQLLNPEEFFCCLYKGNIFRFS